MRTLDKKLYKTLPDGTKVYRVNGTYVRDNLDIGFTMGGHGHVYPKYIPKDEVWLDDNMNVKDVEATLLHELTERDLMKSKGWSGQSDGYDKAHEVANNAETKYREEHYSSGIRSRGALILGMSLMAMGAAVVFLHIRKSREKYSSPSGMRVVLKDYNGKHKDHPEIKDLQKRFPDIVRKSISKIGSKTKLPEPPITVAVELDDSFESDPFIEPSAASQCPVIKYTPEKGNCESYGIRLGTLPIIEGYKGRTTVDKIMTHELTHVFMMFNIPDHDKLPKYIVEGLPIHVAGQQKEIKRMQKEGRTGDHRYKMGEIPVHSYGKLVDEFEEHYPNFS